MLATNNLFVDYFNAFLLNPELGGERLRFNFITGDLELVESKNEPSTSSDSDMSSRVKYENNRAMFSSTAESVKRQLETQIKAIIKSTSSLSNSHPTTSTTQNRPKTAQFSRENTTNLFEQIKKWDNKFDIYKRNLIIIGYIIVIASKIWIWYQSRRESTRLAWKTPKQRLKLVCIRFTRGIRLTRLKSRSVSSGCEIDVWICSCRASSTMSSSLPWF